LFVVFLNVHDDEFESIELKTADEAIHQPFRIDNEQDVNRSVDACRKPTRLL